MIFKGLPPAHYIQGQAGRWEIEFESDVDHAIYFCGKPVAGTGKERNADQKEALAWLQSLGLSYGDILDKRKDLLVTIKNLIDLPGAQEKYPYLAVPVSYTGSDPDTKFGESEVSAEIEVYERDDAGPLKFIVEAPPNMAGTNKVGKRSKRKLKLGRSTAEAYASGIEKLLERNADEIIKGLKDNPDQQQTKPDKEPKESKKVASKFVNVKYGAGAKKAPNFNAFVGGKIMSAFKNAAIARKEFVDMGGSVEDLKNRKLKDRFISRALGFEFGGDAINRTRGTFSSDPELTQDPALTRGQRFSAGIRPLMSSTLPSRAPEPPDYSAAADAGLAPDVEIIDSSYSDILSAYSLSGSSLEGNVETEKRGTYTDFLIKEKIQEIYDKIGNRKKIKEEKLELSREEKEIEQEASDKKKISKREKLLEGIAGAAGVKAYIPQFPDDPIDKLADLIFGSREGDGEEEDSPWWQDLLGFGLEIAGEEASERGIKGLADKFLKRRAGQAVTQQAVRSGATSAASGAAASGGSAAAGGTVGGTAGGVAGVGAGAAAAIILGAGLAVSAIGEGAFQLRKMGKDVEEKAFKNYDEKSWTDPRKPLDWMILQGMKFTNHTLNGLGTTLDILGSPFRYAIELIRYPFLNEEDKKKQATNLAKFDARIREQMRELLNVATLGLGFKEKGMFGNIYGDAKAQEEMMSKMASGTAPFEPDSFPAQKIQSARSKVMVGEANSSDNKGELVGNKAEIAAMVNKSVAESVGGGVYSGARLILGVIDNLLSRSGPIGSALKPFITQKLGAAMKYFGMEEVNESTGFGLGQTKDATPMNAAEFLTGSGDGSGDGGGDREGGPREDQLPTGTPLPKDKEAAAKVLMKGLMDRGFTKIEAAAIVGNLWAESGFDPKAVNPKSRAYGLMQWLDGRKDKLDELARDKGKSIDDVDLQLDYIAWELKGGNPYETSQFQKAMAYGDSVALKTKGFGYEVERAADWELEDSMDDRIGAAQSAYSLAEGGGNNTAVTNRGEDPSVNYRSPSASASMKPDTAPAEKIEIVSNNMSTGGGVVIMPIMMNNDGGEMMDDPSPVPMAPSMSSSEPDRMKMLKNIIRERQ